MKAEEALVDTCPLVLSFSTRRQVSSSVLLLDSFVSWTSMLLPLGFCLHALSLGLSCINVSC